MKDKNGISELKTKKFYIFSVIFLCVLAGGFLFWRNFKYHLVNKKLDGLVTGKSKGLYQINYKNLVIDEVAGNISVEKIELVPDSGVFQSMVKEKTAPEDLFKIRIPFLHITGVKTPKALLNKEISAHIIRIENAEIEFRLGKKKREKKTDFTKYLAGIFYRQLLGNLKSIKADSVVLENATLVLIDKGSNIVRTKLSGLSIRFAGTSIDSVAQDDSTRILFSRELEIHCNEIDLPFSNKLYTLHITGLDYNSVTARFHTGTIRLKPRLSETEFAAAHHFATDRMDVVIGSLDLMHINRQSAVHEELDADSLLIDQASVHIFRDKSYKHDSVDRTHGFPQESIMLLPFTMRIKKMLMTDSYIEYKEKNDKSDSSGKVAFFHIRATLDNLTNMPGIIRQHNRMHLIFNASFLNETPFSAVIDMRLNDKTGRFQLDARMGSINAISLNPLLKPMALAELNKGKINRLSYHLEATNTYGKGNLIILYQDLSVKLIKKDDNTNKYKTKFLPSLAAGLLVKDSNPQHGKTRIGNVDYTRDVNRSIFNFMWKSLFSGIKQIVL